MEPNSLNFPADENSDDARIEAHVRGSASLIPDEGFSRRVLAALPSPRHARARATTPPKWILCSIGALLGAALATWQFVQNGGISALPSLLDHNSNLFGEDLFQQGAAPLQIALIATASSLAYVYRHALNSRRKRFF